MRVVVYPHVLELGGSQLNAIEIAAAVRDLGHDVVVFGQPGQLNARIAELELEFVAAPRPRGRPSPPVMHALCRLVRSRGVDLVHGYEWTTALEAYWGPRALLGVPAVATVQSAAVAPFMPFDLPVIVGTEQLAAQERDRRPDVDVIEPPVDLRHNGVGVVDGAAFKRDLDLDPDALTVVVVCRLVAELKLEGVLTAIDVVADLDVRLQLVIVGDGAARAEVERRAEAANARAGRRAVVLTGELLDPRPAYAAADICLGMGGSALRAMAFGHPLVVQGEHGFWELLTPESERTFLWTGWYGIGEGAEHGAARLAPILRGLAADGGLRARLGAHARELVERKYSLARAGELQVEIYERALADAPIGPRRWLVSGAASARGLVAHRTRRRVDELRGRLSMDDFNSRPVVLAPDRDAVAR